MCFCTLLQLRTREASSMSSIENLFFEDNLVSNLKLESSPNLCVNCFRHNMQEAA